MTDKQKFLDLVETMYGSIRPIKYYDNNNETEKLEELNRWTNDFVIKTRHVEETLNNYVKRQQKVY